MVSFSNLNVINIFYVLPEQADNLSHPSFTRYAFSGFICQKARVNV